MVSLQNIEVDLSIPEDYYVPDQLPADWNIAKLHAKAMLPGNNIPDKQDACPCCMNFIYKDPVPYWEDYKELGFLGAGFPLFYNFIKFCIIMLLALTIDSCVLNINLSSQQNNCQEQLQSSADSKQRLLENTINCGLSVANTLAFISPAQENSTRRIIKILGFIGQLLILLYFREKQTSFAEYIDQKYCTMSDYAIFVEGIPKGNINNKRLLKQLIHNKVPDLDKQINGVLIIQDCKDFHRMTNDLDHIVKMKKEAIKKEMHQRVRDLDRDYFAKEKQIAIYIKYMKQKENLYFIGSAFLVLSTDSYKQKTLEVLNNLTEEEIRMVYPTYDEKDEKLVAKVAREPTEIIWDNIHYSRKQRIISFVAGWLVSTLLLMVTTTVFFFLIKEKSYLIEEAIHKYKQDPGKYLNEYKSGLALGYLSIILVNFFNKFIYSSLAHKITDKEKHQTYSSYQQSFALKYALGMFFTTALMTLLVEAIVYKNYSHSFGVVEEETFMFVFNAVFSPLVWLINPQYIISMLKRKHNYGDRTFTQEEANNIMEYPTYDIGKRYADVLKTMWFTFLYAELIPIGAVFSLVGLILYYLIDKYVLLRKSSIKGSISNNLSKKMISWLELTLILKPAGELIFNTQIRGAPAIEDYLMLGIGFIYILLPINWILKQIFNQRFKLEQASYQDIKHLFPVNYFTLYPLKRIQQRGEYLQKGSINFVPQSHKIMDGQRQSISLSLISQEPSQEGQSRIHRQRSLVRQEHNPQPSFLNQPAKKPNAQVPTQMLMNNSVIVQDNLLSNSKPKDERYSKDSTPNNNNNISSVQISESTVNILGRSN